MQYTIFQGGFCVCLTISGLEYLKVKSTAAGFRQPQKACPNFQCIMSHHLLLHPHSSTVPYFPTTFPPCISLEGCLYAIASPNVSFALSYLSHTAVPEPLPARSYRLFFLKNGFNPNKVDTVWKIWICRRHDKVECCIHALWAVWQAEKEIDEAAIFFYWKNTIKQPGSMEINEDVHIYPDGNFPSGLQGVLVTNNLSSISTFSNSSTLKLWRSRRYFFNLIEHSNRWSQPPAHQPGDLYIYICFALPSISLY